MLSGPRPWSWCLLWSVGSGMFTRVPVEHCLLGLLWVLLGSRDCQCLHTYYSLGTGLESCVIPGIWYYTWCLCHLAFSEDLQSLLQTWEGQSESVGRTGKEKRGVRVEPWMVQLVEHGALGHCITELMGRATEGPVSWSSQPSPTYQLLGHRFQTAGTIPIHGQRLKQQTSAAWGLEWACLLCLQEYFNKWYFA